VLYQYRGLSVDEAEAPPAELAALGHDHPLGAALGHDDLASCG
jgi:hypothetical protein